MPAIPYLDRDSPHCLHGIGIMYPSVAALERVGGDWDWIWIDAQHGDLDFREAMDLVRAAHLIARPAFVRVPSHDAGWIGTVILRPAGPKPPPP